jgi:hypothetical protein
MSSNYTYTKIIYHIQTFAKPNNGSLNPPQMGKVWHRRILILSLHKTFIVFNNPKTTNLTILFDVLVVTATCMDKISNFSHRSTIYNPNPSKYPKPTSAEYITVQLRNHTHNSFSVHS